MQKTKVHSQTHHTAHINSEAEHPSTQLLCKALTRTRTVYSYVTFHLHSQLQLKFRAPLNGFAQHGATLFIQVVTLDI